MSRSQPANRQARSRTDAEQAEHAANARDHRERESKAAANEGGHSDPAKRIPRRAVLLGSDEAKISETYGVEEGIGGNVVVLKFSVRDLLTAATRAQQT